MKKRVLTALLAVTMVISLGTVSVWAEGPNTVTVNTSDGTIQGLKTAIESANDGDTIVIPAGQYTGGGFGVSEIEVDKAVTIKGEGNWETELTDVVFSVVSASNDHDMSVTFENLRFTGASQIKVGFVDKQNSVYDQMKPTMLTIDNCYAYLTHSSQGPDGGTNKGQLVHLDSTYNTNLDLTITSSTLINAHTIPGEDASPIVNGNGTNIVKANITGNIIGSENDQCERFAIKFARRQDNTQIDISNNIVYGATTADKDFYILDMWQSGGNSYGGLAVSMNENRLNCKIEEGRSAYVAYIEGSVQAPDDNAGTVTAEGNYLNGTQNDAVENMAQAGNMSVSVAKVGDQYYTDLAEAIKAADVSNGTVIMIQDVTVETWNQLWNISGVTLDGQGHTLKVNNINSLENHDALIQSAGDNVFYNLNIDLSGIASDSAAQGYRAFDAADGDRFTNVNITGNEHVAFGIFASGSEAENETITIANCKFEDLAYAIGSEPASGTTSSLENIIISGSKFTDCNYAGILYSENTTFTGNEVVGGRLNIMHPAQVITGNTFTNGSRIKFYANPQSFVRNIISSDSYLDTDENAGTIDVAENYWGGEGPSDSQLGMAAGKATGTNVYYTRSTMRPEDLNTYVYVPVIPNVPGTYPITVADPANGAVSVSLPNASEGAVITVTAKPDEGYVLAYVTVDGQRISGSSFTMPGHAVTVSAVFVRAGLPFTDVAYGDWFYDEVAYVYANGLMEGVSDTAFEPGGGMTRAMVWAILARIDGVTVTGSNWAETARSWAMAKGISDGENASAPVTREQLVTMLYRYAGEPVVSGSLTGWADAASVSGWAGSAMTWAVNRGIITGATESTLAPADGATRAQCAAILMRYIEA